MDKGKERSEVIQLAREYINGEPYSDEVTSAYRQMEALMSTRFQIDPNDIVIETIGDYVFGNDDAIDLEELYLKMKKYVMLPDCPKCGIDGSTAYHPDSTDGQEILICMVCGYIGFK